MSDTLTSTPSEAAVQHTPGTFCWWEILTTDVEAAKEFYSQLFSWTYNEAPLPDGNVYVMLQHEGVDIGGLYHLVPFQVEQNIPPHWMSYIATDNVETAIDKTKVAGGQVITGPEDVSDAGRMAILTDPTGATFAVWQALGNKGAGKMDEFNTVCWNELSTRDQQTATTYYSDLFGYEHEVHQMGPTPYVNLLHGKEMKAGILQMNEEWGEIPPCWTPYFSVENFEATAAQVVALGGKLLHESIKMDGIGQFVTVQDPQGAAFSIIQLEKPA